MKNEVDSELLSRYLTQILYLLLKRQQTNKMIIPKEEWEFNRLKRSLRCNIKNLPEGGIMVEIYDEGIATGENITGVFKKGKKDPK